MSTILIVTYTMDEPAIVVGVFYRALRLGQELVGHGHRVVIENQGPIPDDPKVHAARGVLEIGEGDWLAALDRARQRRRFAAVDADLVVFGEGPFDTMEPSFEAALSLDLPTVLLDQFYQGWLVRRHPAVDRMLLYALEPLIAPEEIAALEPEVALVPPFIEAVTPRAALPVPPEIRDRAESDGGARPWVTLLGVDPGVHEQGIALVASLPPPRPLLLVIAPDPERSAALLTRHGLVSDGEAADAVALGLLADPDLFGVIAASAAVVLANGYMQILEALALATPALAIGRGVGLEAWTVDDRLERYLSIEEDEDTRRARLGAWLEASPFPPEIAARLRRERHGARRCADEVEAMLACRSVHG